MQGLHISRSAAKSKWVVYFLLTVLRPEIQFVGACRLEDVYKFPGYKGDSDTVFNVMFDSLHDSKIEADKRQVELIKTYGLAAKMAANNFVMVECIETGERWKNAHQAAIAHDIDHGALKRHLARRPGYKSVKSRTYRNVTPW